MRFQCRFIFFIFILSISLKSFAEEDIDLFDLSLEQLMNVKVAVSSSFQQSLKSTPGIVRVFNKETIKANGWQSLEQLLLHVPGVQISVSKNGHSNIWMRGVQNRNNNKVLLLIDGTPQQDLYYGNFNINNQVPMHSIEKVEVLNGPGGVVHGANSFAGVIAITTKSQGKSIGISVESKSSYSSATSQEEVIQKQAVGDYHWVTDFGNFYFFTSILSDDGFQPQYNRRGEFVERDVSSNSYNLLGKYQLKSFDFKVNYSDYSYPYRFTKSGRWQGYDKQVLSLSTSYSQPISSNIDLELSGFYKHYDFSRPKIYYENGIVESEGESIHNTSAQGAKAVFLWPVSAKRHISFGLNYDTDWSRKSIEEVTDYTSATTPEISKKELLVEDNTHSVFGMFTEYQQEILSEHWLHFGLRYDNLSNFENQFNYRISITKESDNFYYKALLGTSYRVPTYREYLKKYSEDYTQKNSLSPEQMKTFEVAAGYNLEHHDFSLVWYINNYKDFIKELNVYSVDGIEIDSEKGDEYAFNFDEIRISGLEFTWLWTLEESLFINSSFSYLLDATENPGALMHNLASSEPVNTEKDELNFLSDLTASIEINYHFSKRYQFYWDLIYYSDRGVPDNYQENSAIIDYENANGFLLSNMSLQITVNEKLNLSFSISNLFDENIYSPSLDPASDYDSQWSKRKFNLSLYWQF